MDFNLSREHQLIRKMMADFTETEVKPIAAETDRTSQYPRENIEKLFDLGVMGMCVPKEYGGAGADPLASAICIEELSKQCASTGDILATVDQQSPFRKLFSGNAAVLAMIPDELHSQVEQMKRQRRVRVGEIMTSDMDDEEMDEAEL